MWITRPNIYWYERSDSCRKKTVSRFLISVFKQKEWWFEVYWQFSARRVLHYRLQLQNYIEIPKCPTRFWTRAEFYVCATNSLLNNSKLQKNLARRKIALKILYTVKPPWSIVPVMTDSELLVCEWNKFWKCDHSNESYLRKILPCGAVFTL